MPGGPIGRIRRWNGPIPGPGWTGPPGWIGLEYLPPTIIISDVSLSDVSGINKYIYPTVLSCRVLNSIPALAYNKNDTLQIEDSSSSLDTTLSHGQIPTSGNAPQSSSVKSDESLSDHLIQHDVILSKNTFDTSSLSADANPYVFLGTASLAKVTSTLSVWALEYHVYTYQFQPPKFDTSFLCTDGGSRSIDKISASGWILYNSQWNILAGNGTPFLLGSNNDAELKAALEGLSYASSVLKHNRIIHLTDSTLVARAITGNCRLNSDSHQSIRHNIIKLQESSGNLIFSYQIPREFNSGSDRMCNLAMDSMELQDHLNMSSSDIDSDRLSTKSYVTTYVLNKVMSYAEASTLIHQYKYKLVLTELVFMSNVPTDTTFITPNGHHETKSSVGSSYVTGFETNVSPHLLDGIERIIPLHAIQKLRNECSKFGIPWHDSAFAKNSYISSCPHLDIALLSSLCRAVGNDVCQVISWFRDQTETDPRPNKHLRPDLYRKHLEHYDGLSDLCLLARDGFKSRVASFTPPRPFSINHQSALERGPAVQRKLVKEAMLGRTLLLEESAALADLRVNTLPYAVAEKKGIDYSFDGRLIHNASYPKGSSVNDAVPLSKLDASTDDVRDIAHRVLALYHQFPSIKIFGMCADVDSAFQNAHAQETSAVLFGGKMPESGYVAIALTAIFGYRDSPAIFAILAKAAQFFHRMGKSEIYNVLTPFHSWIWVDDFIGIEPDINDRLLQSEIRIRSSFHLVFGSPGWNDEKFAPWSNLLHAVGLNWNLMNGTVSMPDVKIIKTIRKVQQCLDLVHRGCLPTLQSWRSLVGTLRHIGSCIPSARPFYHSFVSMEKILVSGASPKWKNLECDLQWFLSILNKENLNGITMERFVQHSDRTIILFLSWTSTHTFLIDFRWNKALVVEDTKASLGGLLLEYYMCSYLFVPFANGPFPRNDLQVNLLCKTADAAHRITNWEYQDHSLRQLGWFCTQQHVTLICTGPKLSNIDLSKFTNTFFQVLLEMPLRDVVIPLALPFVQELLPLNMLASEPVQEGPTDTRSSLGLNFVTSTASTKTDSTRNLLNDKIKSSGCTLLRVAWGSANDRQCVPKHSATSDWLHSKHTIKSVITTRSQWECVWKWAWRAIDVRTPQPHRKSSHLVPTSCGFLGAVHSWGSSPYVVPAKSGVPSSLKEKITCSSGTTSPLVTGIPPKKELIKERSGSTSILTPTKAIVTRRAVQFDLEGSVIRCYVPSKRYGGYRKEETLSSCGIIPIAEFQKSRMEWSFIGKRSSTVSRKLQETKEWIQKDSLDTLYGSEEPRNLWQQALTPRSSNSWVDGSQTATWPTSDSIQI